MVQRVLTPDEWIVCKGTLSQGRRRIICRRLGTKEAKLVLLRGQPHDTQRTRAER